MFFVVAKILIERTPKNHLEKHSSTQNNAVNIHGGCMVQACNISSWVCMSYIILGEKMSLTYV